MGCFIFGGGGKKADGDNLDFSQVTMEPQFGLAGKKFFNKNKELKTGTILNWDGTLLSDEMWDESANIITPSLTRRYIPSGKYLAKDVVFQPMPEGAVSVSLADNRTFRVEKTAGYIPGGTDTIAFPPGKVLADGTYEGPYQVGIPSVKYYYLQTAGKVCTQNIKINNPATVRQIWATPKSSTTIEIPLTSLSLNEMPVDVSLIAGGTVSSGQLVSAFIENDDETCEAYKLGTGHIVLSIDSWIYNKTNEKLTIKIVGTGSYGASFKTSIEYFIVMHTVNSGEWNS